MNVLQNVEFFSAKYNLTLHMSIIPLLVSYKNRVAEKRT